MRLSMEDVKRHKENKYEVMCRRGTVRMSDGNIIGNLCDTIEAQHDEIESLKNWNACSEEDHERLVQSDKRRIELEEEVEQFKMFTGEIEPNEGFIELLQSNRTELIKWLERCVWHVQKVNELDRENQLLKEQVAAMREVILELKPSCGTCNPENCESDCETLKMFEMIDAVLSGDAGKGYHNPADLEALKLARESVARVEKYANVYAVYDDWEMVKEALTAIDKAIGGGKVE